MRLEIKEIVTIGFLRNGNREKALEVCKEHGISEERFAELEQIFEEEKREREKWIKGIKEWISWCRKIL